MRDLDAYITLPNGQPTHFQYREFVRSDLATRLGIPNLPLSDDIWRCLEKLVVEVLEPVRLKFGPIRVTSGYRSPDLCDAMPGTSRASNHARGQAADIEPLAYDVGLYDILAWIHHHCQYRELIAEYFPNGWVHVAYREGSSVKVLKLKDRSHNYTPVDLAQIKKLTA
jgi:zinc D-Ala-D-Ala carboxypeptidase